MLKKEYNNTTYTASQISNAVHQILANEKSDYKIANYLPDAIELLCRTGYNWSITAEIMWDKVDAQHLDIIIECRNSTSNVSTAQVQQDYEERHLNKICDLFFKYINIPPAPIKKPSSSGRWIGIILGVLAVAAIAVLYVFETMRK